MSPIFRLYSLGLVVFLCAPLYVRAAEFGKYKSTDGQSYIITVGGRLTLGDEKKFVGLAIDSPNATVVLQSPGGNLFAGIEIGKAIHIKGFATYVPNSVQCASACALAWLGGRVRYMSDTAHVGFHAAYIDAGGQATVSSAGNALVGAYLNQLGLPAAAIVYITETPPDGIQWLNLADAQRFGIDVRLLDISVQPASTQNNAGTTLFPSQVAAVTKETYGMVAATNLPSEQSLSYVESKYIDQINYYGKVLSKASVLNDKREFFKKWPERKYSIEPRSIRVACQNPSECKTEGILDFETSGPLLKATGSASFRISWVLEEGIWKIKSESSRVIDRQHSLCCR